MALVICSAVLYSPILLVILDIVYDLNPFLLISNGVYEYMHIYTPIFLKKDRCHESYLLF